MPLAKIGFKRISENKVQLTSFTDCFTVDQIVEKFDDAFLSSYLSGSSFVVITNEMLYLRWVSDRLTLFAGKYKIGQILGNVEFSFFKKQLRIAGKRFSKMAKEYKETPEEFFKV